MHTSKSTAWRNVTTLLISIHAGAFQQLLRVWSDTIYVVYQSSLSQLYHQYSVNSSLGANTRSARNARRPDEQQIIVCRRQYTDYSALSAAREENNAFKTANTGGEK